MGGTKFLLTLLVVLVLLGVLAFLALTGALGEGLATVLVGAITGNLVQFGAFNTRNNSKYLEVKHAEITRLAGAPVSVVLSEADSAASGGESAGPGHADPGAGAGGPVSTGVQGAIRAGQDRLGAGARTILGRPGTPAPGAG